MERFWSKVDTSGECWMWIGKLNNRGYGAFYLDRRIVLAHRTIYAWAHGSVPEGLVVDHQCNTPACVRPSHLKAMTQLENVRRGRSAGKTHCVHGHPFTPESTIYRGDGTGWRSCRICKRERDRRSA
jgi:hypothetical protein